MARGGAVGRPGEGGCEAPAGSVSGCRGAPSGACVGPPGCGAWASGRTVGVLDGGGCAAPAVREVSAGFAPGCRGALSGACAGPPGCEAWASGRTVGVFAEGGRGAPVVRGAPAGSVSGCRGAPSGAWVGAPACGGMLGVFAEGGCAPPAVCKAFAGPVRACRSAPSGACAGFPVCGACVGGVSGEAGCAAPAVREAPVPGTPVPGTSVREASVPGTLIREALAPGTPAGSVRGPRGVPSGWGVVVGVSCPAGPSGPEVPAPPSSSTYGRIRSGSKSSAAAAWAVRASRRASAARWVQAQEGDLSRCLGAPHSGHGWPLGGSTRSSLPSRTPEIIQIFSTVRSRSPRNERFQKDSAGHTPSHRSRWKMSQDPREVSWPGMCTTQHPHPRKPSPRSRCPGTYWSPSVPCSSACCSPHWTRPSCRPRCPPSSAISVAWITCPGSSPPTCWPRPPRPPCGASSATSTAARGCSRRRS